MILKAAYNLVDKNKKFKSSLWASWYRYIAKRSQGSDVLFLNYGYLDTNENESIIIDEVDEKDRICIQLYHQVVNSVDLSGQNVLEMSCGHGGGASYISRYLKPKSYIGSDRTQGAIDYCKSKHVADGLSFQVGDALDMPFEDNQFDVIVNVEASHCYPDLNKFLSEVCRTLKPGGYFLYTDFRDPEDYDGWIADLKATGLDMIEEVDITANVVLGMESNSNNFRSIIDRVMPPVTRRYAHQFAGTPGSNIYKKFSEREKTYHRFVFQKLMGKQNVL